MLTKLSENVWVVEHSFKIGGVPFTSKMSLILLSNNQWVAISAVPLEGEALAEVKALGDIAYIIAPNNFHHLFVTDLMQTFPAAKLYMPKSLQEKRSDLSPEAYLDTNSQFPWDEEIQMYQFNGAKILEEYDFFHKATGTLIFTDICFNLPKDLPLGAKIFAKMTGTHGGLKTSRLTKLFVRDRSAAKQSIEAFLALDFDRLIVGHGDVIKEGAKNTVRESFHWLLKA